jgi:hypothetical protein
MWASCRAVNYATWRCGKLSAGSFQPVSFQQSAFSNQLWVWGERAAAER